MSRAADWATTQRHDVRVEVAPALPPAFDVDALTPVCSCGWRGSTHAGRDAEKRAGASRAAHLSAATRKAREREEAEA